MTEGINRARSAFINKFYDEGRLGQDEYLNRIDAIVTNFSPRAKTYLSFLTNSFLEADIFRKIMADPDKVNKIKGSLLRLGVGEKEADEVLGYFAQSVAANSSKSKTSIP